MPSIAPRLFVVLLLVAKLAAAQHHDHQHYSSYSGVGSCAAGQYATALTRNAIPTCSTVDTVSLVGGTFGLTLLPDSAGGRNLGSAAVPWGGIWGTALTIKQPAAATGVEIGNDTGSHSSLIDLHGSATYSDFATRLIRSAGDNGAFQISHRGTGTFSLIAQEAAAIEFRTANTQRLAIGQSSIIASLTTSPVGDATLSLGTNLARWASVYLVQLRSDSNSVNRLSLSPSTAAGVNQYRSHSTDGASARGHQFFNENDLATGGARIAEWYRGTDTASTNLMYLEQDGDLHLRAGGAFTDTAFLYTLARARFGYNGATGEVQIDDNLTSKNLRFQSAGGTRLLLAADGRVAAVDDEGNVRLDATVDSTTFLRGDVPATLSSAVVFDNIAAQTDGNIALFRTGGVAKAQVRWDGAIYPTTSGSALGFTSNRWGTLNVQAIDVEQPASNTSIEIGNDTGSNLSHIDWHASATHTDYASRIIRNTGDNGSLQIIQRGTGNITIANETDAAGIIDLRTGGTQRLTVSNTGVATPLTATSGLGSGGTTTLLTGTLMIAATPTSNTVTSAQSIMTYSLPANTLTSTGRGVRIKARGTVASAQTCDVELTFAGNGIGLTGLTPADGTGAHWEGELYVVRTATNTQRFAGSILASDTQTGAGLSRASNNSQVTETESSAQTIAITVTGSAVGACAALLLHVEAV